MLVTTRSLRPRPALLRPAHSRRIVVVVELRLFDATSPTIIPGFNALAQAVSTEAGTAKTVTLTSQAWKDTATPKYTVVSGPAHGSVAPGSKANQVIYTPAAGYTGADSFTFAAKDPTSSRITPSRSGDCSSGRIASLTIKSLSFISVP